MSIPLIEKPGVVASSYFIKDCQRRETEYTQMRKNIPAVFKEIEDYIESIETDQLCLATYPNNDALLTKCKEAYFGLLKNGLSSSMNLLLNHF